jgi:glyoxylase-like metal-dependent hydrolase (beta-lactamase superfamily II)
MKNSWTANDVSAARMLHQTRGRWALALGAAACLALATGPASADPMPPGANPSAYQLKGGLVLRMGDFEVFSLIDRDFAYPATRIPSKQTPEQWAHARHLLTPDGMLRSALGGYLIRNKLNKRVVLVDLGLGPYSAGDVIPAGEHNLLNELAALGYKPTDVTDVVLTHLHLDHAGWASVDGRSTFRNAKYHLHASEWDHWIKHPPVEANGKVNAGIELQRTVLKAVETQVQSYKGTSEALFAGFTIRHVPGHTPGSSIVQLESGGQRALILGDTAHSPMSLQDKTWPGSFDMDEKQCLEAKNALIDEAIATNAAVSAGHVSGLRFGHIVQSPARGLIFYYNEP